MNSNQQYDAMQLLLNQLDNGDPNMRQLLEQHFKNNIDNKKGEPTKDEILRRFRIQNKKLLEQIAATKEQLKAVREEQAKMVSYLDYFLKLNNALSAALGSCDNCWGDDASCEKCGGQGTAGWQEVNKRFFNLYVQPCLDKINLQRPLGKQP